MELNFYYIKDDYIDFLKRFEKNTRGFTCVPNANYWNTNKFTFGAVLEVNKKQYFVPISSYSKKQQDVILITDKSSKTKTQNNRVLGSLRFAYMIPAPRSCIIKLDINKMPTENSRVHTAKELAFCRRNRDKIQNQARKTYDRVVSKQFPELTRNSCDFKLLEQAYIEYCKQNNIELPTDLQESNNKQEITVNDFYKKSNLSLKQVAALAESGIPFNCKKTGENSFVIVFDRINTEKINKTLSSVSEQEQPPHQPKIKR